MSARCEVCQIHAESTFRIEGMDCHEEVAILERTLKRLAGIEALDADVIAQRLRVKHDAAVLTPTRIADAVARTGMRAWLEHETAVQPSATTRTRARLVGASGAAVAAGLAAPFFPAAAPFAWVFCAVAVVLGAIYPGRRAWISVRSRVLDINVLMVVAVAGAVALGEWSEAASVVFLFALAQLLETRAMERARSAIRSLMDLAPAEALVRGVDGDVVVPVDDVRVGDVIVVRPGEKIALDGKVRGGRELRQRGAGNRRVASRREITGLGRVCRHHQRARCAGGRRHEAWPRFDDCPRGPPGRTRAGAAGAEPDVHRSLRPDLHAGRADARGDRRGGWPARPWRLLSPTRSTDRWCCW